ncbi:MAG: ornithine cyclodeaminase family protein [Chloroflexi bacterium]|nr:ornithine cyclodeaminase family protein [Chloroflexota bacterium]
MLFLNNQDVESLLDMPACLDALETGYRDLIKGDAGYRGRIDTFVPCERQDAYYRWGTMEGACRTFETFAIRMKSDIVHWPEGKTEEKYCMQPGTFCGLILVLSTRNAEPLALINDGYLQHMRVGGCAGLGVKYLSRQDSRTVGILGSGGMARTYLRSFCAVRPIERVKVHSPSVEHRETYAQEMSRALGIKVEPVDSPEKAARGVDILATATDSILPTLKPEWARPGRHLTNLSDREVPTEVLSRCDVVIKLGSGSVRTESLGKSWEYRGEVASLILGNAEERQRIPIPKTPRFQDRKDPHLIEVMANPTLGRRSPEDITFFANMGTQGLQFASVAGKVVKLAKEKGVGRQLPTDWFVQDIRD